MVINGMDIMKNDRIWKWFDSGDILNALIGSNKYFIPDVTYRDSHDLILILSQLILWADNTNNNEIAANELEKYIHTVINNDELEKALDIIRTYYIVASDMKALLPIDELGMLDKFIELINRNMDKVSNNTEIINVIVSTAEYWPALADRLKISVQITD